MAEEISTKPYLIRALYEWCADSGYTPYIAVAVDEHTRVPREFVRNGEIVLNVSGLATNRLKIDNDGITFQARFGGVARELAIPIANVISIYARETGHGMAFDVAKPGAHVGGPTAAADNASPSEPIGERPSLSVVNNEEAPSDEPSPPVPPAHTPGRPKLTRIK